MTSSIVRQFPPAPPCNVRYETILAIEVRFTIRSRHRIPASRLDHPCVGSRTAAPLPQQPSPGFVLPSAGPPAVGLLPLVASGVGGCVPQDTVAQSRLKSLYVPIE